MLVSQVTGFSFPRSHLAAVRVDTCLYGTSSGRKDPSGGNVSSDAEHKVMCLAFDTQGSDDLDPLSALPASTGSRSPQQPEVEQT